ncbi:hypothetical protein ACQUW5_03720 [Legionella sp. CNM-1927-20]|uniref:hypothetical protein n=1 Tax=Legionella sp. CNM-1927-20 TaxID=3422221 RepID=UPI00403A880B
MKRNKINSSLNQNLPGAEKKKNTVPSATSPVRWPTKGVEGQFYQPKDIRGFSCCLSYIMLDENGTLLMAGQVKNDKSNPLFLQEIKTHTQSLGSSSSSQTTTTSTDQGGSVSAENSKPESMTHAYVGYNGVLEENGAQKKIQVFFFGQPSGTRVANGDHGKMNSSVQSIIKRNQVALDPQKESQVYQNTYTNVDGKQSTTSWTVTPETCLFGSNRITLYSNKGIHYFCGECESLSLTVDAVKRMLGHTLEGINFNTKGTATANFKAIERSQIESEETLNSFIPGPCMVFTVEKPPGSNGIFDDKLVETIRTPGRWQECIEQSLSKVKAQRTVESEKRVDPSFFRKSQKQLSIVGISIHEDDLLEEELCVLNSQV